MSLHPPLSATAMKKLLTLVPTVASEALTSMESDPKQRLKHGLKQLEAQAERINLLSAELERSIWEFQEIATQVNQDSRFFRVNQRQAKRFQICEYRSVHLPAIRQKSGGRFVVTSHYLDLTQPKRKVASSLTQKLQQWLVKKMPQEATK
jgi:hypothetical protein